MRCGEIKNDQIQISLVAICWGKAQRAFSISKSFKIPISKLNFNEHSEDARQS